MKGNRGFTLVEIVVALFVLAAVSALSYQMLVRAQGAFETQRDLVEAQENARAAISEITGDLRQISYRKDPTQPSVVFAGVDSIVFVADLYDTIPGAEVVSIHLSAALDSATPNPSDRLIERVVWDTAGATILSAPIAYGISDSGLTFFYYNRDGTPMSFPIVQPEHIGEVEVALTSQTAHAREEVGFQDVTVTSTVFPRNLPFTPPMPRPNPPGCGALTSPNCESLTLAWTTPTENTDGSALAFNDISHFSVYYGTNPDSMNLDSRLARNVNIWTVRDLVGGTSYYLSVTATSVADVESHPCQRQGSVGASAPPRAPASMGGSGGTGAIFLSWSPVTEDTIGNTITAEVRYSVYRGQSAGVLPIPGNLIASDLVDTTYTDLVSDTCMTFYYRATATACGREGGPSNEMHFSLPARPSCPPSVNAQEGGVAGQIVVTWLHPTTRVDATPLPYGEIAGYRVFYSLASGVYSDSVDAPAGFLYKILNGLQDCMTYYVNVAAIDDCGTRGVLCGGREAAARTSAPCNEFVPVPPAALEIVPGDQRMELTWPANRTDCDLDGYLVYYGRAPGQYDGTEAAEGPSPIFVNAAAAHIDSSVGFFALNTLEPCTRYYLAVACVDVCSPPHESSPSPEMNELTVCGTCEIEKACVTEIAEGPSEERVRFQIGNEGSTSIAVEEIEVDWTGGASLLEILAGGTAVWKHDGSAGEGPSGPQGSPALIDVSDFSLTPDDDFGRPKEMTLVFGGTETGDLITLTFETNDGFCSITLSPCALLFSDSFTQPDGPPAGWTPRLGSKWGVVSNQLRTTSDGRITPDALGFALGDYTASARVKVEGTNSNRRAGFYVRYRDTGNYYLLRLYPASNEIEFLKMVNNGALVLLAQRTGLPIATGQYYDLKVAAYGNALRVWFQGALIDWDGPTGTVITDGSISTGNICMYAYKISAAWFDDVRVEPTCGCGGAIP
ncbi:MAG: prepilin-type N-terminal cleavage/methylation domain-containing protein [Candidatus Eisenbacteria bacterium]